MVPMKEMKACVHNPFSVSQDIFTEDGSSNHIGDFYNSSHSESMARGNLASHAKKMHRPTHPRMTEHHCLTVGKEMLIHSIPRLKMH